MLNAQALRAHEVTEPLRDFAPTRSFALK
jgi:hypothetical protein